MDKKAFARTRLAARRARIDVIRSRVWAFSIVVFLVVWVVIAAQLIAGHDPALAAKARVRKQLAIVSRQKAEQAERRRRDEALNLNQTPSAPPPDQGTASADTPAPPSSAPAGPDEGTAPPPDQGSSSDQGPPQSSPDQSSPQPAPPTPVVTSQS